MKCLLIFTLVCCLLSNATWAAPPKKGAPVKKAEAPKKGDDNELNPTITTGSTYLLGKMFGATGALVSAGVIQAANDGLKTYQRTHNINQAVYDAGWHGLTSAKDFMNTASKWVGTTASIINDVHKGKDVKSSFIEQTQNTAKYLKSEIEKDPNGKVAKSLIAGSNVFLTWTIGPIPAWVAAAGAKAASEGAQHYKETKDVFGALKVAAASGRESALYLITTVKTLVTGGTGMVKDIVNGKDAKSAITQRADQALKNFQKK
ncbi:uncharacterized protein LOC116339843 [Contarinia nasturtii]|uniref:uncharacterized protein LOC116339843 n=1 Tax=Contarinia nasturtii TaxID=265458 RepID=UPI0012D38752|nr:uncharacterized protein LOC116339843 [Contarinia nasturtii]